MILCYCESVKNITVSVPDDVYRAARVRAAEQGQSLSSLVTQYLVDLTAREAEFERLEALQDRVIARITRFRRADRLSRDDAHSRAVR